MICRNIIILKNDGKERSSVQYTQKKQKKRYPENKKTNFSVMLSTYKKRENKGKPTYTLSYAHYPHIFWKMKGRKRAWFSERMFCEVIIKNEIC